MMRRIPIDLPWSGVAARVGVFGIPGAESRLSPGMRRVHQSRCARALALELLDEQGVTSQEICKDPRGRPQWPPGFTGSLSHTNGHALAATAPLDRCAAVGVDIEPALPLPADADTLVLTIEERRWLDRVGSAEPAAGRLVFCAKECVHKALEPLRDAWLEFADVRIEFDAGLSTFVPHPLSAKARGALAGLDPRGVIHRIESHWVLVLALFDSSSSSSSSRHGNAGGVG
ncbi:MAG: 4'-phosphopantetheinyl transferase family protein [Panacagrimonas sp.]